MRFLALCNDVRAHAKRLDLPEPDEERDLVGILELLTTQATVLDRANILYRARILRDETRGGYAVRGRTRAIAREEGHARILGGINILRSVVDADATERV